MPCSGHKQPKIKFKCFFTLKRKLTSAYSPYARKAWVRHFLQCQYDSYKHFLESGLKESFHMFRTVLSLDKLEAQITFEFLPEFYKIKPPRNTILQCIMLRRSWLGLIFIPLKVRVQPRKQTYLKPRTYIVWLGLVQCPLMTRHGHFIVRGVPRVVLSQMVRRAGVYFRTKLNRKGAPHRYVADIIAARGTWLRLEMRRVSSRRKGSSAGLNSLRNLCVHLPAQPRLPFFAFLRLLGLRPGAVHPWIRAVLRSETQTWTAYPGHSLTSSTLQAGLFGPGVRYDVPFERQYMPWIVDFDPVLEKQGYNRYVRFSDLKKVKFGLLDGVEYQLFEKYFKKEQEFSKHPLWTERHFGWAEYKTLPEIKLVPQKDMAWMCRGLNYAAASWCEQASGPTPVSTWMVKVGQRLTPRRFQRHNYGVDYPMTLMHEFPCGWSRMFPEAFQYGDMLSTYDDMITVDFFGPLFYDLGRDGRKHLNETLGLKTPAHVRTLTCQDVLFSAYALLEGARNNVGPETSTDHLSHKVLKPVGALLQQTMLLGLIELRRNVTRWFRNYDRSKPFHRFKTRRKYDQNLRLPQRKKVRWLRNLLALPAYTTYAAGSTEASKARPTETPPDVAVNIPKSSRGAALVNRQPVGFDLSLHGTLDLDLPPNQARFIMQTGSKPASSNMTHGANGHLASMYGLQRELKQVFHCVPFNKALRRFFGTNPLCQFLDETNPIAELTHKRRLSFMGLGGLDRYNATMDVRSIHPSHYGRICPIETPEGQNAGLVHSLTAFAHVGTSFILTPYFPIYKTWIETRKVVKKRLDAHGPVVPGDIEPRRWRFQRQHALSQRQNETPDHGGPENVRWKSVSPRQVLSLATSCIAFMEHNDGNRALMGSNMQRQAISLVLPQSPIVASGMESKVNAQSQTSKKARQAGFVVYVEGRHVCLQPGFHTRENPAENNAVYGVDLRLDRRVQRGLDGFALRKALRTWKSSQVLPYGVKLTRNSVERLWVQRFVSTYEKRYAAFLASTRNASSLKNQRCFKFKTQGDIFSPDQNRWHWSYGREFQNMFLAKLPFNLDGRHKKLTSSLHPPACKPTWLKPEPTPTLNLEKIPCHGFIGCNQHTYRLQRPCVDFASGVTPGGFVSSNAYCSQGALSLGQNLTVGYTPWQGYNFEDAILINARLVWEDILTSLHIEHYDLDVKHLGSSQRVLRNIMGLQGQEAQAKAKDTPTAEKDRELSTEAQAELLSARAFTCRPRNTGAHGHHFSNGVLKPGTWATEGTVFLHLWRYGVLQSKQRHLLRLVGRRPPKQNRSLTVPWQIYGRVLSVTLKRKPKLGSYRKLEFKPSLQKMCETRFQRALMCLKASWHEFLPCEERFKPKPKNRDAFSACGKKQNVFSQFDKDSCLRFEGWFPGTKRHRKKHHDALRFLHGRESLCFTLATPRRIQVGDKLSGRHGNKGIVSRVLQPGSMPFCPDGTPLDLALNPLGVPSRMNVGQLYECLLGFAGSTLKQNFVVPSFDEAYGAQMSRCLSLTKLYEARLKTGMHWVFNPNFPGKVRLFDGRSGQAFLNPVLMGKPYILKLIHCVEEKLHARNTGPYNLITQQPLRGRRRKGGQRVGEMEVWALEGFGAAYVLHELLTLKSDSMVGRYTVQDHILSRTPLTWDNPESFKLLAYECLALGFNLTFFHRGRYHKDQIKNQNDCF